MGFFRYKWINLIVALGNLVKLFLCSPYSELVMSKIFALLVCLFGKEIKRTSATTQFLRFQGLAVQKSLNAQRRASDLHGMFVDNSKSSFSDEMFGRLALSNNHLNIRFRFWRWRTGGLWCWAAHIGNQLWWETLPRAWRTSIRSNYIKVKLNN